MQTLTFSRAVTKARRLGLLLPSFLSTPLINLPQ